jgi:hypothetical protein
MTPLLLVMLIVLDLALLGAVIWLSRRQDAQVELAMELTEERRLLTELRQSIHEELEAAQSKARATLDKAGGQTIAREMDAVATQLTARFEAPLKELGKRKAGLEALLQKAEREKTVLQKVVARGEKICRFFDERVPYEDVLHEIEDKKYADARKLLARGHAPAAVAVELGMSESEVRLVAGLAAT